MTARPSQRKRYLAVKPIHIADERASKHVRRLEAGQEVPSHALGNEQVIYRLIRLGAVKPL